MYCGQRSQHLSRVIASLHAHLGRKHDHDGRPVDHDQLDGVEKTGDVGEPQQREQADHAGVSESRDLGGLFHLRAQGGQHKLAGMIECTHHLYAVAGEPVEHLEEEQADEEDDKGALKVVLEDGEGKEGLGDGEPASFL